MRIAVLMSGQARYMEQSAYWWRERTFPDWQERMHVDYFLDIWDDGTPNLDQKIKDLYNPVYLRIRDYETVVTNHIAKVKDGNEKHNTDWHLLADYVKHTVCYEGAEMSQHTYNFPGMYLASAGVAEIFEPYADEYDIAIKTRTDCVLNPMADHHWQKMLGNMLRQKAFNDTIFTPWLRIRNGMPFFGDLCFLGRSKLMLNFIKDMDKNLVKLATHDKHLLSDFTIDPEIPFAHWLWSRLSIYSRTDWLALSVVWPVPFGQCLIRTDESLNDKNFQWIDETYNKAEADRHTTLFHKVGDTKD
tara:strand:+ start:7247 stop:8152 length:906 start_codon:yes stop_codon:yes gene_type:complete